MGSARAARGLCAAVLRDPRILHARKRHQHGREQQLRREFLQQSRYCAIALCAHGAGCRSHRGAANCVCASAIRPSRSGGGQSAGVEQSRSAAARENCTGAHELRGSGAAGNCTAAGGGAPKARRRESVAAASARADRHAAAAIARRTRKADRVAGTAATRRAARSAGRSGGCAASERPGPAGRAAATGTYGPDAART